MKRRSCHIRSHQNDHGVEFTHKTGTYRTISDDMEVSILVNKGAAGSFKAADVYVARVGKGKTLA